MVRRIAALLIVLALASTAHAQSGGDDFEKAIAAGDFKGAAAKLRASVDLTKVDPALRWYVEKTLEYLDRGARPERPGSEIVVVRGGLGDRPIAASEGARGKSFLLPGGLTRTRLTGDERLRGIDSFFAKARRELGRDSKTRDLASVLGAHARGDEAHTVFVSTSTIPLEGFGPPYYIMKVAPERAIFNFEGQTNEHEVLLPFFVLPNEIVAVVNSYEEVLENADFKASKLAAVSQDGHDGLGTWRLIEANIRAGREPLTGLAGLSAPKIATGVTASADQIERFEEKVRRQGGRVERVPTTDPRLPWRTEGRTYLERGRPVVVLAEGAVQTVTLASELAHAIQLRSAVADEGATSVNRILTKPWTPKAQRMLERWELEASRVVREALAPDHPDRARFDARIADLERGPRTGIGIVERLVAERAGRVERKGR